jgi:hypothetical protein
VFSCALPSSAWCASACPTRCAGCIHDGENSSCRRSAVLALP